MHCTLPAAHVLVSATGWDAEIETGETVDVRVRRADGRLSAPLGFTR